MISRISVNSHTHSDQFQYISCHGLEHFELFSKLYLTRNLYLGCDNKYQLKHYKTRHNNYTIPQWKENGYLEKLVLREASTTTYLTGSLRVSRALPVHIFSITNKFLHYKHTSYVQSDIIQYITSTVYTKTKNSTSFCRE